MRALLDTNILIHREAGTVINEDIGVLFYWLDRLHYEKCVHPESIREIARHKDPKVVKSFEIKLGNYVTLKTVAPESAEISAIRAGDSSQNDKIDTDLLREVSSSRVDLLITEDGKIHAKAKKLGIADRVFTIDSFLEKVTAENPGLATYKVLSVAGAFFGDIDVSDPFFDSFRRDYPGFDSWFNRKADEVAYVCKAPDGRILAFLYVKVENPSESYSDIEPRFGPTKRLKIGTFKVSLNGYKLGERFLKIVFDNAVLQGVTEIYVTIFDLDLDQQRLISLLSEWGFVIHGTKRSAGGVEKVFVRVVRNAPDITNPKLTFPYMSGQRRKFLVPIYPAYHTELLPDSILRTEKPQDFVDNESHRNAISKVYISRSYVRNMNAGDIAIFYRTGSGQSSAYYTACVTTLAIIEAVHLNIATSAEFIALCRKRSVFTDAELLEHWNYNPNSRPFVVDFLYVHSFPKRPIRKELLETGLIPQESPRGFLQISDNSFRGILKLAGTDESLVVY